MATLTPYVIKSLEMGQGELRARFINEFSDDERQAFADHLLELADANGFTFIGEANDMHLDDWEQIIPELAKFW